MVRVPAYLGAVRVVGVVVGVDDGLDGLPGDQPKRLEHRLRRLVALHDVHHHDAVLPLQHDGVGQAVAHGAVYVRSYLWKYTEKCFIQDIRY